MIFVAQPYYSTDNKVIAVRVEMNATYCGALLNMGMMCISPIVFGAKILDHVFLPGDFSFWDKISFALLERSTEMHVLTTQGWEESRGVKAEIERATELGIPIKYVSQTEYWKVVLDSKIRKFKNV